MKNKFAIFLTESGLVYSMGNSNKYGELGHGDFNKRLYPCLIEYFKSSNEKIVQISCGFKHVAAKSSTGKAYTWGYGGKGQLGLNSYDNYSIPTNVIFNDKFCKIYQIAAGFRSTLFMCENRKIYACGCNSKFTMEKSPILFDVIDKFPEISLDENLSIIKIVTTWNKCFSIIYAIIADYTSINESKPKINFTLNWIASNWDYDSINPPYYEKLENYIEPGFMKKKFSFEFDHHKNIKEEKIKDIKDKNNNNKNRNDKNEYKNKSKNKSNSIKNNILKK